MSTKKFHALHELQRRDLIQYFFKRESAVTQQHPNPPYEFPLKRFCGYFRRWQSDIRKAVLGSDEYKAYAEERRRPPPPPVVDKCAELDRPSQVDAFDRAAILSIPASTAPFGAAAGTKRAAPDPDPDPEGARTPGALQGAVARAQNCDVAGEAPSGGSPVPPQSHGEPLLPVISEQCPTSFLKDAPEAQAPALAGEPSNRIPIVQQGVLRRPRAPRRAHSRPRAPRGAVCDSACGRPTSRKLRFGSLHAGRERRCVSYDGGGFIHPAARRRQ